MGEADWKVPKSLEFEGPSGANGTKGANGSKGADGSITEGPLDDDGRPQRTGTTWTASAHVITAVIGSGVLSLAWSIAQLGWIAGPIILLFFALVTYFASVMLTECYRYPDPVTGERNYTYMDAVRTHLGGRAVIWCGLVQYANLLGTSIGYTITSSISMVAIKRSGCFHTHGHNAPCHVSNNIYMIVFGLVQIVLSQIPDFGSIWWLSYLAAVMSFSYSTVGLGLAVDRVVSDHGGKGTISVGQNSTQAQTTWKIFQALGNIAFAYSFSMILIEIQDTLKSKPAEKKVMKKATTIGTIVTTVFYMAVGLVGYAAFGQHAPGNLMTGFGFYDPYWLVDFANACIVVHLVGAYQVFSQPLFAFVESNVSKKYPLSRFVNKEHTLRVPCMGKYYFSYFRVVWRTIYVIVLTVISMLIPFFNDVMGIIGALGFWPLTVYFPMEMYIVKKQIPRWSGKWVGFQFLSLFCLLVTLAAAIGSVEGMLQDLRKYKPFHTGY